MWNTRRRKRNKASGIKNENKKFINERFLTRRGLEAKLLSQKKELTTETLKVEQMIKNEDMVELEESDSMDMKDILNGISSDDVLPAMKLLWETQIRQLSPKSSKGYGWNPRFANS